MPGTLHFPPFPLFKLIFYAVGQGRDVLRALNKPIPGGAGQARLTRLRTAVRQAIGLLPL
jgi:hypothetical protein